MKKDLLLTFYGDDFTGSTDSMEVLARRGVRTVLFLKPPTNAQLSGIQAVGVAGVARSLDADGMAEEINPVCQALRGLGAPYFHYKICSTFDSSPKVGSIGRAIEIASHHFPSARIPLIPGAPFLKRFVCFGNLFATVGDETHRLDRHPTMSRHPITPMDESDIRLHLARQTRLPIDLIDWRTIADGGDKVARAWDHLSDADHPRIVLFDTMRDDDLRAIGELLWARRPVRDGLLVGSSGVEYALAAAWRKAGLIPQSNPVPQLGEEDAIVAVSGSASPQTRDQIKFAIAAGWSGHRLDTQDLTGPGSTDHLERIARETQAELSHGRSVVLYSALGPDDPAIRTEPGIGTRLARSKGILLKRILERSRLRRAVVAGGDTSGHAARELGIYALEMAASAAPGGPICRARSDHPQFDGLQIVLKGGQVGGNDFFEIVRKGGQAPT